jgi:hypothetical protein
VTAPPQLPLVGIVEPNANLEKAQLMSAAWQVLVERLISWDTDVGLNHAGVKNNSMGFSFYSDQVEFDFHLASFVDGQGKPVLDLESAIKPPNVAPSGAEWYLSAPTLNGLAKFIIGSLGAGVAGAKLRVRLVLGNDLVGRHPVEEIEAVTDTLGNARFVVQAGSHPEDVSIYVLIEENPVNPWFKPTSWGPVRFFHPDNKVADSAQLPAIYHFKLDPKALAASSRFTIELAERIQTAAMQRKWGSGTRSVKQYRRVSQVPPET